MQRQPQLTASLASRGLGLPTSGFEHELDTYNSETKTDANMRGTDKAHRESHEGEAISPDTGTVPTRSARVR